MIKNNPFRYFAIIFILNSIFFVFFSPLSPSSQSLFGFLGHTTSNVTVLIAIEISLEIFVFLGILILLIRAIRILEEGSHIVRNTLLGFSIASTMIVFLFFLVNSIAEALFRSKHEAVFLFVIFGIFIIISFLPILPLFISGYHIVKRKTQDKHEFLLKLAVLSNIIYFIFNFLSLFWVGIELA